MLRLPNPRRFQLVLLWPHFLRDPIMKSVLNPAKRRVLLIDDNIDATTLMQLLLTQLGYAVETASSGWDGLKIAETFLPQVIFCDLGMPVMSGYTVAAQLRGDIRFADVFLIALTGWEDQQTRAAVAAAGFDRHLTKPAGCMQIIETLDGYFATHEVTDLPADQLPPAVRPGSDRNGGTPSGFC